VTAFYVVGHLPITVTALLPAMIRVFRVAPNLGRASAAPPIPDPSL